MTKQTYEQRELSSHVSKLRKLRMRAQGTLDATEDILAVVQLIQSPRQVEQIARFVLCGNYGYAPQQSALSALEGYKLALEIEADGTPSTMLRESSCVRLFEIAMVEECNVAPFMTRKAVDTTCNETVYSEFHAALSEAFDNALID